MENTSLTPEMIIVPGDYNINKNSLQLYMKRLIHGHMPGNDFHNALVIKARAPEGIIKDAGTRRKNLFYMVEEISGYHLALAQAGMGTPVKAAVLQDNDDLRKAEDNIYISEDKNQIFRSKDISQVKRCFEDRCIENRARTLENVVSALKKNSLIPDMHPEPAYF